MRHDSGQAAVELAVLAPVLALAVLVFAQLALAFRAELAAERAAGRAQAAAVLGRPVLAAAPPGRPPGTRARACAPAGSSSTCPSGLRLPLPQLARVHLSLAARSGAGVSPRGERGTVAVGAVALLLALALVAGAGLRAGRGLLLDERVHGSADAVALAAAGVLELRYGEARRRRRLAGGAARDRERRARGRRARRRAARRDARLDRVRARAARPLAAGRAGARAPAAGEPPATARAGIGFAQPVAADGFRLADVRGLDAAGAVVAAALAQLGWPYVWGGESRAEGGFDCSGLVDYALAAAGHARRAARRRGPAAARPAAAGGRGAPARRSRLRGRPAHHVGLVVAPGLAVEAPHRGALVHVEPLGAGGWTGAGRILPPGAARSRRRCRPRRARRTCRCRCAPCSRAPRAPSSCRPRCSRRSSRPRAASIPRPCSPAGAQGIAQFMPATWAGEWNPQRERSPFEPGPAIAAQARLMHLLLERAGGDVASALAAYNAGPGVLAARWPRETRAYVARIMRRFGGPATLGGALPAGLADAGAAPPPGGPEVRLLP